MDASWKSGSHEPLATRSIVAAYSPVMIERAYQLGNDTYERHGSK